MTYPEDRKPDNWQTIKEETVEETARRLSGVFNDVETEYHNLSQHLRHGDHSAEETNRIRYKMSVLDRILDTLDIAIYNVERV